MDLSTYVWSIDGGPAIIWLPICAIGWLCGNGEFDGIPNCGPPKCGVPNDGPELLGRPNGGAFTFDGEPKGPLAFGPFGGAGKPPCGGAGPGVDDPEGAGDAALFWINKWKQTKMYHSVKYFERSDLN